MFKPQFAPLVKSGVKRQTIRPFPKRMPKVGDKESWRQWSGLPYRSPQVELARVELTRIKTISLVRPAQNGSIPIAYYEHQSLSDAELLELCKRDGFSSTEEMFVWFEKTHGLPFTGILIQAKDA
jgi:hypothetical protein